VTAPRSERLLSADAHVVERPDLFDGLAVELRSRAPRLEPWEGGSAWMVEGHAPVPLPALAVTPDGASPVAFDDLDPACYDPAARLVAQDQDSIDAEILHGSPGLWDVVRQLDDPELRLACTRAYNDWIAGFGALAPDRLVGLARIPTTSATDAAAELQRAVVELGLRGAVLDAWPSGGPGPSADDDELWEVVHTHGVPVTLHHGFGTSSSSAPWGITPGVRPPMSDALPALLGTGLFDRWPGVRLVLAHGDAGWAFHWLEFMDANYARRRHLADHRLPFPDPDALPSEYLRRHCWFSFHQDRTALKNRNYLGTAHLLWASHFPYDGSDWPDDRQQAMQVTDGLAPDERRAVLGENTARLYRLPGYEDGFPPGAIDAFEALVHL
jgi:predicted TIM-barrel fold metal-dependent hydrolase